MLVRPEGPIHTGNEQGKPCGSRSPRLNGRRARCHRPVHPLLRAAPSESVALQAVQAIPAQMYILGQPGTDDGPQTGEPVTGIGAVDGSGLPVAYVPGGVV